MTQGILQQWSDTFYGKGFVLALAAVGRGLDFATTWVGIGSGKAIEGKPVASHIFEALGHPTGMIFYELMITTPAIFLGCWVVRWMFRSDSGDLLSNNAERTFLFFVGIVSLSAAVWNSQFLL